MLWLEDRFPDTEIALVLSYTSNWAQALYKVHLTWLNHCWSLSIEEQFYLLWPLVIVGLERLERSPAKKVKMLLGGALLVAIYRATRVGIYSDERINFGLDTRMDTLMAGAALAYFVQSLPTRRLAEGVSWWLGGSWRPRARRYFWNYSFCDLVQPVDGLGWLYLSSGRRGLGHHGSRRGWAFVASASLSLAAIGFYR